MSKASYTCPQCSKVVHDLAAHKRRMHSAAAADPAAGQVQGSGGSGPGAADPAAAGQVQGSGAGEILTVTRPTKQRAAVTYHCVDCGTEFAGQVPACPGCNAKFNWESVGNATN